MAWLLQYVTPLEIEQHNFLWDPDKQLLIFPVYDGEGECIYWQGRNFSGNGPKYLSRGSSANLLHILNPGCDTIVLVEDLISAIVVSRYTTAMPLWGSNIPAKVVLKLADTYKNICIWLDMDKTKEARHFVKRFSSLGIRCASIHTLNDPKLFKEKLNVGQLVSKVFPE